MTVIGKSYVTGSSAIAFFQFIDGACHLFGWLSQFRLAYSVVEIIWLAISVLAAFLIPSVRRVSALFLLYMFIALFSATIEWPDLDASVYMLPNWFGLIAILFSCLMMVEAYRYTRDYL